MKSVRVLVIEDNHDFALMNCIHLKKAGFAATAAHSGAQALNELTASPPDVIVMDLTLPDMDADTFVSELRERPQYANTPVILASGREDIAERAKKLGCPIYLKKPFDSSLLLDSVQQVALKNE